MADIRFSEDVKPLSELKKGPYRIVEHACKSRRPVLLTRRGRGVAVLLDLREYERLRDRADFVDAVRRGAAAAEKGDVYGNDAAESILDEFGQRDE